MREKFVAEFDAMSEAVHESSKSKGWWREEDEALCALAEAAGPYGPPTLGVFLKKMVTAAKVALCHSELSELLEGDRLVDARSDKIPEFLVVEEEAADVVIRLMDLGRRRGWRVGEAIVAKARYNSGREYMHGGKLF